jgi:hypothetical protein
MRIITAAPVAPLSLAGLSLVGIFLVGCGKGLSNFEGDITIHTTRVGYPPADMVVKAKGDKLRFETPTSDGKTASAIFLPAENKLVVINDAQKVAMDMDLSGAKGAPNTDPNTSEVEKTGKKETIAGLGCEDYTVKDPSGKHTEVCIAEGLAFFDLDAVRRGSSSSWSKQMREKKMFPLRSVEFDQAGKEISRTEVTKIDKAKLDDSVFQVPGGYQHMALPGTH